MHLKGLVVPLIIITLTTLTLLFGCVSENGVCGDLICEIDNEDEQICPVDCKVRTNYAIEDLQEPNENYLIKYEGTTLFILDRKTGNKILKIDNPKMDFERFKHFEPISNSIHEYGYTIIKSLPLFENETKTIYIQKTNPSSDSICFADTEELKIKEDIAKICTKIKCPGRIGNYECKINGEQFEISGLKHSGALEVNPSCTSVSKPNEISLYVDPEGICVEGKDDNPGTVERPLKTLEGAKNKIREIKQAGEFNKPITVYLRKGNYLMQRPLKLELVDSGTNDYPIKYTSYPKEIANITGGMIITPTWNKFDQNIYVAHLPKEIYGDINFNSLFVDGQRATRARTPNEGTYYRVRDFVKNPDGTTSKKSFYFNDGEFSQNWRNLNQVQVVATVVWENPRLEIASIDEAQKIVNFTEESHRAFDTYWSAGKDKYYIDNVFEGLDSPGEWYFDKKTRELYYWPKDDQNILNLEFIIPISKRLIEIEGKENEFPLGNYFSISTWIKTTKTGSVNIISNTGTGDGYGVGLFNGIPTFFIGSKEERYDAIYNCGNKVINDGNWHHLAFNFDLEDKTVDCYSDGTKTTKTISKNFYTMNRSSPKIGNRPNDGTNYFLGNLDETYIYNRTLSQEEVLSLYKNNHFDDAGLLLHLAYENNYANSGNPEITAKGHGAIEFVDGKFGKGIEITQNSLGKSNLLIDTHSYLGLAKNVSFENIDFSISDWNGTTTSFFGTVLLNDKPQSAIKINGAQKISFINNKFYHLGGHYAIELLGREINIIENKFSDLGGGAVYVRSITSPRNEPVSRIVGNEISYTGKVFKDTPTILSLLSANNEISKNIIKHASGSGISLGGNFESTDTGTTNNLISKNNISHVCEETTDCGAIQTIGKQEGTIIENNIIHDLVHTNHHLFPGHNNAIYLDQGSANKIVRKNIVYKIAGTSLVLHSASHNLIENNIFVDAQSFHVKDNPQSKVKYETGNTIVEIFPTENKIKNNIFYSKIVGYDKFFYYHDLPGVPGPSVVESNNNIIYSTEMNVSGLDSWRIFGFDQNSLIIDPLFSNYDNDDYSIQKGSPAFSKGFLQIDISEVRRDFLTTLEISSPQNNSEFDSNEVIPLILKLSPKNDSAQRIYIYENNNKIGLAQIKNEQWSYDYFPKILENKKLTTNLTNIETNENKILKAVAIDHAGNKHTSNEIVIKIKSASDSNDNKANGGNDGNNGNAQPIPYRGEDINEISNQTRNLAPQITIISPTEKQKFTYGEEIIALVNTTDTDRAIIKVEFFIDDLKIGEKTAPPYSFSIKSLAKGSHKLSARALDNNNAYSNTAEIGFDVEESIKPPQEIIARVTEIIPKMDDGNKLSGFSLKLVNETNNQQDFILQIQIKNKNGEIDFNQKEELTLIQPKKETILLFSDWIPQNEGEYEVIVDLYSKNDLTRVGSFSKKIKINENNLEKIIIAKVNDNPIILVFIAGLILAVAVMIIASIDLIKKSMGN